MSEATPSASRKRRPPGAAATEKRLLAEVLDLKDQVHNLVVAIERSTNAHAQSQILAQRDIVALENKVTANQEAADKRQDAAERRMAGLETWQSSIETERSEQRGAARVRKSLLAIVAGGASLAGGFVVALLNWFLKSAA